MKGRRHGSVAVCKHTLQGARAYTHTHTHTHTLTHTHTHTID